MCLLAIEYRSVPGAPILMAANREEFFGRSATPPAAMPGSPQVICGTDQRGGGTWLGVNQHRLLVAVTNRPWISANPTPRSRGLACREMLDCNSAAAAVDVLLASVPEAAYSGANFVALDPAEGFCVRLQEGTSVQTIEPGLHLLTNGDMDDQADPRQSYARELIAASAPTTAEGFVAAARDMLSRRSDVPGERTIVVNRDDRGTVSSTIVAVTDEPSAATYLYAPGAPDVCAYDNLSDLLRGILATD